MSDSNLRLQRQTGPLGPGAHMPFPLHVELLHWLLKGTLQSFPENPFLHKQNDVPSASTAQTP